MKKILIVLLSTLFFLECFSQKNLNLAIKVPVNSETGKVDFTEVVQIDSISQKELYLRAREWFSLTFVSSKSVLEMDDKDAGMLIGKSICEIPAPPLTFMEMYGNWKSESIMKFIISVYLKDSKYKYSISEIKYEIKKYNGYGVESGTEIIFAEDFITPEKIEVKSTYNVGIKVKYRDITIEKANNLIISLKAAMAKKSKSEW